MHIIDTRALTGKEKDAYKVRITSILTFIATISFCIFFELTTQVKVIRADSPFAIDPFDAIGSFAIQIVPFVSLLTLARLITYQIHQQVTHNKIRFILHGNIIALAAITATLIGDIVAETQRSSWGVPNWGTFLVIAIAIVTVPTLIAIPALLLAYIKLLTIPSNATEIELADAQSTLGSALDDLLFLAQLIIQGIIRLLPFLNAVKQWLEHASQKIGLTTASRNIWHAMHIHPWRFCVIFALIIGITLSSVHYLAEGAAPTLARTILTCLFFFGVEFIVVILGFALLGGFLGLRPPLLTQKTRS